MISIIIPVYNVEKYLPDCLNSILAQTYTDYEVILVNDGSTDSSGGICDEYAKIHSQIKVFHQQNSGVSVARNNGIERARGEWITFVDSDDWLDKDFLSFFNLKADTDLSVTGLRYIRCPERVTMKEWGFDEIDIRLSSDFYYIAKNNLLEYGTVCCKAYKKIFLDKYFIRFDERLSFHEDHLFLFQYLQHIDRVSLHKCIGYNYRITYAGQSLSSKVHPWNMLNASGDAMFREFMELPFSKGLPMWYFRKISSFCLEPKIIACQFVFASNLTLDEKKSAIQIITKDVHILKEFYHPNRFIRKLQKVCMFYGYLPLKVFYEIIEIVKKNLKR